MIHFILVASKCNTDFVLSSEVNIPYSNFTEANYQYIYGVLNEVKYPDVSRCQLAAAVAGGRSLTVRIGGCGPSGRGPTPRAGLLPFSPYVSRRDLVHHC